jgi:hypothetical protein
VDLSANAFSATTVSHVALVPDRFGNPGLAGSFAGATSYIEVAVDPKLPLGASPRTVSVWIQTTQDYSMVSGGVWNWGSSAMDGFRFGLDIVADDDYFVGEDDDVPGTHLLNDGNWHNLVVEYDGTTVTIWVDAFYSASKAVTLDTTGVAAGDYLEIGRSTVDHSTPEPYVGNIDDLRIYDRILTEDERGELYLEGGWH